MFLGVLRPGTRVSWSIGRPGETPDLYPARVYEALGRQVSLIVLRKNQEGEEYLTHVRTSDNFVQARNEMVDDLDTPTVAELAEQVIAAMAQRAEQKQADAQLS